MRKNILKVAVTGAILTMAIGLTGCGKSVDDMIVDANRVADRAEKEANASKIVTSKNDEKDIKITIHGVTFPLTVGINQFKEIAEKAGWKVSGILQMKVTTEEGTFIIDTMDGAEGEETMVIHKLDFNNVPTDCVKITGVNMNYVCQLLEDWEDVDAELNEYVELTTSINSIKLVRVEYKDR